MDEAKELGATRLNLSGGEPMLHTFFWDIFEEGIKRDFEVHLYSSGTVFRGGVDSPLSGSDAYHLADRGAIVAFNLFTLEPQLHDWLAGSPGSYHRLMQSIMACLHAGVATQLNLVPLHHNAAHIVPLYKWAAKVGIYKINLLRLVLQGRAKSNREFLLLSEQAEDRFVHDVLGIRDGTMKLGAPFNHLLPRRKHTDCSAREKIVVTPDYTILPCEAFKGRREAFAGPATIEEATSMWPFKRALEPLKDWTPNRCPVHHIKDWP
jgi:MoaA/NifB/PqqE/SkfB family radical SAM enzyme